ncbi:MAG: cytochrome c oxidase subunit II [Planctomycetota bacterium]
MTMDMFQPQQASSMLVSNVWDDLWWRGTTGASTFADGIDTIFFFIFWVSLLFFIVLMGLMVLFAWAYRRRQGYGPESSASHNTTLEITWTVIPSILFLIMFLWGFKGYLPMQIAPSDSEVINVSAYQWGWEWTYDTGAQTQQFEVMADVPSPVFAVPVGRPVKLIMSSRDVIHSAYISQFRVKRDIFPNKYTTLWFQAEQTTHYFDEEAGEALPISPDNKGFHLACTEYCGDQHSQMWGRIAVMAEADYQAWKAKMGTFEGPLHELGKLLHTTKGCAACHSVDGSQKTGPTWQGVWMEPREFTNAPGESYADETEYRNYMRESILEPHKKILAGYPNQMQSYQGQLTDREMLGLLVYMKTLSSNPDDVSAAMAESAAEMEAREAGESESEGGEAAAEEMS